MAYEDIKHNNYSSKQTEFSLLSMIFMFIEALVFKHKPGLE